MDLSLAFLLLAAVAQGPVQTRVVREWAAHQALAARFRVAVR